MSKLEGKVAIITGGAGGTGRAAAKLFAAEGAKVAALDVNTEWLKTLEEEVKAAGGEITVLTSDLSSREAILDAVDAVVKKYGTVDVLFNNVGGTIPADNGFMDITPEIWDFAVKLNASGPMYITQACLPYMLEKGSGSIIFTSSGGSRAGDFYTSAYAIAKGAVNTMYMYVATQFGRKGIRCNLIQPGLSVNEKVAAMSPEMLEGFTIHNVLPKPVYAADVAKAALFFACDDSAEISGACLNVDAGMTAHLPTYADTIRSTFDRTGIC